MPRLFVHLLPRLTTPDELRGATVVVIDVLRATTTIAQALAAGAARVVPCLEVDDALRRAAELPRHEVVLGGERDGLRIPGFDLGNSPREYTSDRVAGRTIVFTTTNGTRAMQICRAAKRVLTGSLVNAAAVVEALRGADDVDLLCSGTEGQITLEDVLCAGLLVDRLVLASPPEPPGAVRAAHSPSALNDEARLALAAWRELAIDSHAQGAAPERLLAALTESRGGRHLSALGLAADIAAAGRMNTFHVAPELDLRAWEIRAVR